MKNQEQNYIYGRNPVIEAIRNDAPIEKIYIQFGIDEKLRNDIIIKAKKKKINCSQIDKQKFLALEREITGKNNVSQGIIAIKGTVKYFSLDELISNSFETDKNPVIVLLDEINDPHNLGAIARTAECSGCTGIIVTERNSAPITPTAIKASAGAFEYFPVAKQSSVIQTIEKLKENGFWVIGTDVEAEITYDELDYDSPVCLIMGNEGKGISKAVAKHCDYTIQLPVLGKVQSLNVSVTAGIVLYEILRKRNILGE